VRLATEDYVPVAGDDWYTRRRADAEGEFFRRVADQGPRAGVGTSTRQGIYCFTASGKLLACRNSQDPAVMREVFRAGLAAWRKLPAAERAPGAQSVGNLGRVDADYDRTPPEGGLILNVFTRSLDGDCQIGFADALCKQGAGDEAARDHLWIRADEWRALVPAQPRKGETVPVPGSIVMRIARFHLVDDTRGEPPHWLPDQVRSAKMTLTVEEVTGASVRLRLDGSALMSTEADADRSSRGFDVSLLGYVSYDRTAAAITRFDLVAVGQHWGEGTYTRGARLGRTPLGIVFELAKGDAPADRIPPQGARELRTYLSR
jgi:hypothetical protein